MLTGYAAAHQHPFNIAVHLIGIPVIMLGVFVPLSWLSTDILGATINLVHVATFGLFVFYITLDRICGKVCAGYTEAPAAGQYRRTFFHSRRDLQHPRSA